MKGVRRCSVPKYLIQGSYTVEGTQGLLKEGGSGRKAAIEQLLQSVGGRLEAIYFAFGDADVFLIADLPDSASAVAVSLTANAAGGAAVKTTPLITVEEMDAGSKKSPNYRPPGA